MAMQGMPLNMSAMMDDRAAVVAHPLQVALARHQEASSEVALTTASQPFSEISSAGDRNWPPALLTRPSMLPWAAIRRPWL